MNAAPHLLGVTLVVTTVGSAVGGAPTLGQTPGASDTAAVDHSALVLWAQPPGATQGLTWALDQDAAQAAEDDRWSFAGTAKWATLAVSAGAAAYGFSLNSQADEIFARVEESCLENPDRCEGRNPDGSFTDEELESLYQDTLDKDRQARAALLVGQVALAASVVFFIIDLTDRSPPNVPYDPPVTVEVGPGPDGAFVVGARLRLGSWAP
jgi:hypothetical protein